MLSDVTSLFDVIKQYFHGILEAYHFVLSLPNLFISWLIGMPMYFQVGIIIVITGVIIVMIIKLKTFFTI